MEENYSKTMLIKKGRRLAFYLRHDIEAFGKGKIDENGWRSVDELLNIGFSKALLEEIVKTNNKRRYEFNADATMIRARQGHSIPVNAELEVKTPPKYLYHGTSDEAKELILKEGIMKMNRLYVHLSEDIETAVKVGKRHDKDVVVLQIDAEKMGKEGLVFFLSRNGVWLTEYVDIRYIQVIIIGRSDSIPRPIS